MSVAMYRPPATGHVTRAGSPDLVHEAAVAVNAAHRQLEAARRNLYQALDKRAEIPGKQPAKHGTPAGYRAHLRGDTSPCPACSDAHSWGKRRSEQRARRAA